MKLHAVPLASDSDFRPPHRGFLSRSRICRNFCDRIARDVDQATQLISADRERRHQHDGVAEWADDRSATAGSERDLMTGARLIGEAFELNPDHQSATTNFFDAR